ncbi:MAG: dihydropteroate synthase [Marine Group II euryarchaeote MED-G37]|nr:MAG: dihydropteroate synthase [Marine Group II euryarchaeote MED-G37]
MADWRPILNRRNDGFPRIMGILNITPDSFYADSRVDSIDDALARAKQMIEDGADWLDIGGESTRPEAEEVGIDEEKNRVLPVIEAVRNAHPGVGISIDTRHASIAKAALDLGADMVNDVSSLSDPDMANVIIEKKCPVCIMHMQGLPENMQNNPSYADVVIEVRQRLETTAGKLLDLGLNAEMIITDPGIGFGKLLEHNLSLLSAGRKIVPKQNMPLMWGVSRKRMFADLLGRTDTKDRLPGSLGIASMAPSKGVDIIRVHDVREHADLYEAMRAIN